MDPSPTPEVLREAADAEAKVRRWVAEALVRPAAVAADRRLARLVDDLCATDPMGQAAGGEGAPAGGLFFLGPPRQEGDLGSLGPYRVLAELGRGGMGIVLKAHDDALQRTVAIKVLRPDLADDTARARFLHEARALARFQHDHVVRVHAVSSEPGRLPYLVMEHLDGETLAARLRARQRLARREAAALAAHVADGLAAAHAAGLVHRDVKPANVLLESATGRAKVLDFGLARVLESESGLTREGSLAGTPTYMSPEQLQHPVVVDGRTDVYGLGVTLYEMLTGEPPFRGTPSRVLHQVLHEEPPPPRRLVDEIPPDLETITLKAMAKESARRYPTAGDLADDLRRFLAGEPIRARPAGRVERGWRWCRRNPRVAFLSGVVLGLLLLLTTGSVVTAVLIAQDRAAIARERTAAVKAAAEARAAQEEASAHAQAAREHFGLALTTLRTLFDQVKRLEGTPGLLPVKQQLAETAVHGLEQIAQAAEKTPQADASMFEAENQLGDLFVLLGRTDQGRQQFERLRQRAEALLRDDPSSVPAHRGLALAHDKLGDLALSGRDVTAAAAHYREALRTREALDALQPNDAETQRGLSVSRNKLGDISLNSGDAAAAREWYRKALALREGVSPPGAKRTEWLSDLRFTYGRLGQAHTQLGDYAAAAAAHGKALEYAEALVAAGAADARRQVLTCHQRLAMLAQQERRYPAASKHLRAALDSGRAAADADPGNAEARRDVYTTLSLLGDTERATGDLAAARRSYTESLALCEPLAASDPGSPQKQTDLGMAYAKLADLEERAERYAEAAGWWEKGAALCARLEAGGKMEALQPAFWRRQYEASQAVDTAAARVDLEDLPAILGQKPEVIAGLLFLRGRSLAGRGRHAEAAATAELLVRLYPQNAAVLVGGARCYTLCAAALAKQPGPLPAETRGLRECYAAAALATLHAAVPLAPQMFASLPNEPDLDPLRDHPGFPGLLQELNRPRPTASAGHR
jgi:tetratricopeptide (TPR) repeat protein